MALDNSAMASDAIQRLQALGFKISDHARFNDFLDVVMEVVVTHIKSNAEVIVRGGGSYPGEIAKIL